LTRDTAKLPIRKTAAASSSWKFIPNRSGTQRIREAVGNNGLQAPV
jgi:hypothetical protein